MRTFPHFNPAGESICPICGTAEDKETILIPISGSKEDDIYEAKQFHTECIEANWRYYPGGIFCLALSAALDKTSNETF